MRLSQQILRFLEVHGPKTCYELGQLWIMASDYPTPQGLQKALTRMYRQDKIDCFVVEVGQSVTKFYCHPDHHVQVRMLPRLETTKS